MPIILYRHLVEAYNEELDDYNHVSVDDRMDE